ncbi:MAG: radical SAM protein, partial [Oscillospiraceae bacterium]|nr:radical SAM protein [Oscillospiraceae bacterium]
DQGMDLADATGLCADAGISRIRLGSLEPDGLTEDVLDRLAGVPGLCPQFHISVQSGCDRTLAAMHRHYTTEEYAALLTRIRARFPEAAVTTDLMVGFPGETDGDFAETLCFAEAMRFTRIHVFRYSPRPGTPAASAPEQIPEAVKKSRADQLAALGARMQAEFLAGMAGRKVSVLFERERGDGWHRGHAENYAAVQVPSDGADWRGTIRTVTVTSAESGHLLASP